MHKILKFIVTEFIYNGHLQTLGTLAIVVFTAQLLEINLSWDFLIILYLTFYSIYAFDRYKDISLDAATNSIRSQHIQRIYNVIPYIISVILIAIFVLLVLFSNFKTAVFIMLLIIFGFLYPFYFKWLTKKIFIFKNLYVALFFTSLVFLPAVYYSVPLTKTISILLAILAFFVFLKGIMMQILLDLKDIKSDRMEGLRTVGVQMGMKNSLDIFAVLSILTILFLLFFVVLGILPKSLLFLSLLVPLNFYCIYLVSKKHPAGFILESGEFVFLPILVFLGRLVFK